MKNRRTTAHALVRCARLVSSVACCIAAITATQALAGPHDHHEHDSTAASGEAPAQEHGGHGDHAVRAPIGVMGDHVHEKGTWMLSYRYMYMSMAQNYVGTEKIGVDDIRMPGGTYMIAPEDMDMNMHMFGLMYAPTDRITLMAMIPFITKSMDLITGAPMNMPFSTESKGVGDLKLSALIQLFENDRNSVHVQLGFSSPTGSIDETDATPMSPNAQLPYPMQIGSGTFDLLFGATYLGGAGKTSWGAQGTGVVRLGENDRDYRLGDAYGITGWAAYRILPWLGGSFRLAWLQNFNIHGADPALNPAMIPTADPDLRAGRRLDTLFGVDFLPGAVRGLEAMDGVRLAVEGGLPAWQNLDGPQLGGGWMITTGLQYAF